MAQTAQQLTDQRAQYDAERPKSIVELQPFRQETAAVLPDSGKALRLISLNPASNGWFLVLIGDDGAKDLETYHIENPDPKGQRISLSSDPEPALVIAGKTATTRCVPWTGAPSQLVTAQDNGLPYAAICDGKLTLRNKVSGAQSTLERTTGFLRDNIWGGDKIVGFVKSTFYKDAYAENGKTVAADGTPEKEQADVAAQIGPALSSHPVVTTDLGFGLVGPEAGEMSLGLWYPVAGLDGVFASAIRPNAINAEILKGPGTVNPLDRVEARANDYMIAFDLSRFDLGYAVGTDHPRLDWSPRPPSSVRSGKLPGPDGVGSPAPLVMTGMVGPALAGQTIATFAGGFKRRHGAFKWGPFSTVNRGSHYGFIEQGVILSKLQPGLSTLYVLNDGTINMKAWSREDDETLLPNIRFARQNGVPILETDPATGLGLPGALVTQWGAGNWSGSADAQLRTLRAGACLKESGGHRFLVYGYFSTATPSAMARTFQAYGCTFAMQLDMNAPVLTYMALYLRSDGTVQVEHLVPSMSEADAKDRKGNLLPRFVGFADNRDLFYLVRKEDQP
ncbi:hypothetical protein [Pseudooceanicola sp.]|uniref:hypothetical protein n=1 Tax=Pseudooceanicola sp. TaxID=1914328 RepID=UPI002609F7EA|nr:hypothetical protein [Pseudooceanicola sp.]MDF1855904.1 hypothetical protein [Pseudooceanicola sp.]